LVKYYKVLGKLEVFCNIFFPNIIEQYILNVRSHCHSFASIHSNQRHMAAYIQLILTNYKLTVTQ